MTPQLPEFLDEGWVNLPYSSSMNEQYPDMNRKSPGAPYFVDSSTAVSGQWVRLVFKPADGELFWCVGEVGRVVDSDTVIVNGVEFENGGPPPTAFSEANWLAEIQRDGDAWIVTRLTTV